MRDGARLENAARLSPYGHIRAATDGFSRNCGRLCLKWKTMRLLVLPASPPAHRRWRNIVQRLSENQATDRAFRKEVPGVMPPKIHSPRRLCPYAPVTSRSACSSCAIRINSVAPDLLLLQRFGNGFDLMPHQITNHIVQTS